MRYILAFLLGLTLMLAVKASAHDPNMAATPEQARVYQMYSRWMRPGNVYAGIPPRLYSCCNQTDCSLVLESKRVNGTLYVRPELKPDDWFPVPEKIQEINQPDPVESPDGRAHVCIIGGQVACYTAGNGT